MLPVEISHVLIVLPIVVSLIAPSDATRWGEVSGAVVDAESREAVPEALVSLRIAGMEARTDAAGRFTFEGHQVQLDTLIVTHPDYEEARVLLGDLPPEAVSLQVGIRRRESSHGSEDAMAAILANANSMGRLLGGHVWQRSDFFSRTRAVAYPLELLIFSGFIESVELIDGRPCVTFLGAMGCAAIFVGADEGGVALLDGRFPTEVGAFVLVPPGRTRSATNGSNDNGTVAVFLLGSAS